MKVGNFHYFILLLFSSPTYKIKLACTLPNQLCFQYFILLSSHQLVHSLFFSFLSLLFSHPHTSSHTYSLISTLLRLSFKFPLIFVILCCLPLSSTFFPLRASSSTIQLISASSHLTFLHFSLKFLTLAFLFCFIFFCKVRLFTSFLSSSFFFFVEILVLQSKLHADRILNFGRYLLRVS